MNNITNNEMKNEAENVMVENAVRSERKDTTKDKVFLFVIGTLVGAVISTGVFLTFINIAGVGVNKMPKGTPPEMSNGQNNQNGQGGQNGTPPEMPNGQNSQNSQDGQSGQNNQNSQPPEKPSDQNGQNQKDQTSDKSDSGNS